MRNQHLRANRILYKQAFLRKYAESLDYLKTAGVPQLKPLTANTMKKYLSKLASAIVVATMCLWGANSYGQVTITETQEVSPPVVEEHSTTTTTTTTPSVTVEKPVIVDDDDDVSEAREEVRDEIKDANEEAADELEDRMEDLDD
jgi:hypothetical protein